MATKHEMHWSDHTKKAKEARTAGDRDHAVAHQMAADAHSIAGKSHEKQSRFAKQNTRKAMQASQKANNFYKNESVNEISQKTLDTYMDKAAKSRKKSRDYFDKSTSHSQNPKVVDKHKANIDKRTK